MTAPLDVRILALGSPHGDDQVGWCVADRLASDPDLAGCVFKLYHPLQMIEMFRDGRATLIVDACRSGAAPGTVRRLEADSLDELPTAGISTHGGSVAEVLRLAEALGRRPDSMVVLAVEVTESGPGGELTDSGRSAALRLERQVRLEVARLKDVSR